MSTGKETGCPLCSEDEECPGEHELVEAGPLRARIEELEAALWEMQVRADRAEKRVVELEAGGSQHLELD